MTEPTPRDEASHYSATGRPKVGYPSKRVAKLKARQIFSKTSNRLWPYRCGECTGWHLSSSPRRSAS